MPEFPGYVGWALKQTPVVRVTGITHRANPIFQTLVGPGEEHVTLAGLPTEALEGQGLLDDRVGEHLVVDVTGQNDDGDAVGHHLLQMLGEDRRQRGVVQVALLAVVRGEAQQRHEEGDRALALP